MYVFMLYINYTSQLELEKTKYKEMKDVSYTHCCQKDEINCN